MLRAAVLWLLVVVLAGPGATEELGGSGEEQPPPLETGAPDEQVRLDPCSTLGDVTGGDRLDALNLRLYSTVCGSALWVDSFFGNDNAFDDSNRTYGLVSAATWWTEHGGLDGRARFRARFSLPNIDRRLSLLAGRVGDDELLVPAPEGVEEMPAAFRTDAGESWLLGLGYTPVSSVRSHFRIGAGMRLAWPPDPYLRARYRHLLLLGDRRLVRLRETVYWYSRDGLGANTGLDLDWRLRPSTMLRWTTSATVGEVLDGVDYWSGLTVYQQLARGRGISARWWVQGETGLDEPVGDYGVRLVYRQRFLREWLYLDLGTQLSWPAVQQPREPSWGLGLALEMQFGAWS